MEEGIKTIWEALKSNLKIRIICATTFLIAYIWMKNEVVAPKSQNILYFWILIALLFLGLLFLVSVIVDWVSFVWNKKNIKKSQNKFEQNFKLLEGNECKITQAIWESPDRSIVLGEDDPWTISLEDKGIIEKVDLTPEYSLFGPNKKYRYRLTRDAVRAIQKEINLNKNNR